MDQSRQADAIERGHLPTWHRSRDDRAAEVSRMAGRRMSDRTLRCLQLVISNGCEELVAAMDAGALSIAAAAELARLPHDYQLKALKDVALRRQLLRFLREDTHE